MTHDTDALRFTVKCQLDAGHGGCHRGYAEVMFVGLVLSSDEPPWQPHREYGDRP
jgi:hypothetical protein